MWGQVARRLLADPQVVAHVLWAAPVGDAAPGVARGAPPAAPQDPPRGSPRDLLLHHHGLAQLPAGEAAFLARPGGCDLGPHGLPAPLGRPAVGAQEVTALLLLLSCSGIAQTAGGCGLQGSHGPSSDLWACVSSARPSRWVGSRCVCLKKMGVRTRAEIGMQEPCSHRRVLRILEWSCRRLARHIGLPLAIPLSACGDPAGPYR